MIKNWFIVAIRNIRRQRVTSILNTSGLALGITGSLVLFLLVDHLLSIDRYHKNADKIYRIVQETSREGELFHTAGIQPPLPDAFREDFQEVKVSAVVRNVDNGALIGINDPALGMQYHEISEGVAYTENAFFKIFDRPLLKGNKDKVLNLPNEVVISKKLAQRIFPDGSALGKSIQIDKEIEMLITGVMANFPDNTDFPFDMFISYPTIKDEHVQNGWGSVSSDDHFYFLMPANLSKRQVEERLVAFEDKYFEANNLDNRVYYAQPLADLHFDPRFNNFSFNSVNRSNLYAMAVVGFFLILTGCINYINLSTAVAMRRAKEVGVRKVLGGSKSIIIRQFLSETFFITLLSIVIALGLTELLLQFINPMLELQLSASLFTNPDLVVYLLILLTFITVLAGLYPSFILSGFNPAVVLKKAISHKSSSGFQLRRALVVFQFIISQIFIIGTVIVLLQMNFIDSKDMGFTTEAIVNIQLPVNDSQKAELLKQKLLEKSSVSEVSLSYATPASGSVSITSFDYGDRELLSMMKAADENYLKLFDLKLLAGRQLVKSDTLHEVIVNMELVKQLGLTNPEDIIGANLELWGAQRPVVGVVENFHAMSLRDKISPLMIYTSNFNYRVLSAKMVSTNLGNSVEEYEAVFKEIYPEYSMEFEFFEDDIANFYDGEKRMATILSIFSVVAIFIGCIGLYGLISYVTQQKIKEVGIRKVLGATVNNIIMIFSKEFIILIIVAFAIAAPLAGWSMGAWLNRFEYKIELGVPVYLTGILVTLLIAFVTVGYKTFKAATANPVESLNAE